jgi:regulator of cell morphogenesis and NO signaling
MSADHGIDPRTTLGELVAERPARAELFECWGLDYCCGGRQTLRDACAKRGLDLASVHAALAALEAGERASANLEGVDWREAPIAELCAHIVTVHHDGLREAFPRIQRLFATVVRVHGASEPRLRDAQRIFGEIQTELEPHLASEETELFPACVAWAQNGTPVDPGILGEHEDEHAAVGAALAPLRILCQDFDRATALCRTHGALLDALEAFEQDLHRHVHEENNVLFARVRNAHATSPAPPRHAQSEGEPGETLLPCCEGWIGEQTHRWAGQRPQAA